MGHTCNPLWAGTWPGWIRLSRTFRKPFAIFWQNFLGTLKHVMFYGWGAWTMQELETQLQESTHIVVTTKSPNNQLDMCSTWYVFCGSFATFSPKKILRKLLLWMCPFWTSNMWKLSWMLHDLLPCIEHVGKIIWIWIWIWIWIYIYIYIYIRINIHIIINIKFNIDMFIYI